MKSRFEIMSKWTDDELRQQLIKCLDDLSLSGEDSSEYNSLTNWYAAVCSEFKERGLGAELQPAVDAWKAKRKEQAR